MIAKGAVALDPLFIHIRGALTWDEQLEVLSSVTFSKRVAPYRYGFDKLDVLVRGQDKKASFDTLSSLVEGFLEEAKLVSDSVPQTYQVEAIELLGYRADSKLEPHVDYVPGWSIIYSLGATAKFFFSINGSPRQTVDLHSGDVILFPTCGETKVWHGIESFADDKPPWFVLHDYARLCVQFRSSYYHLQLDDD